MLRTVVGGWRFPGIVTVESGAPSIWVNGSNVSSIIPNSGNRPDLIGKIDSPQQVNQWFDTSGFVAPALGPMAIWDTMPCAAPVGIIGTYQALQELHDQRKARQPF